LLGEELQQFLERGARSFEGQFGLRRLQHVIERRAALFAGAPG
jgi:hypothetical protein